jgi:hypothetical protein
MRHPFKSKLEVYVWVLMQFIDGIKAKHIYVHSVF